MYKYCVVESSHPKGVFIYWPEGDEEKRYRKADTTEVVILLNQLAEVGWEVVSQSGYAISAPLIVVTETWTLRREAG